MPLLRVRQLQVHFPVGGNILRPARQFVRAVDGVDLDIEAGETVGVIGASGCGKTTLGRAVVRLIEPTAGTIEFDGRDLAPMNPRELRPLRRQFQIIFQDPYGSLNPRMTVENILGEALEIHGLAAGREARRARIAELLVDVGLDATCARRYPHEFSGGQRQRIGIARALAVQPRLIVCDEPVSALDVSVQAQIVNLLRDLQAAHGLAYLFVAHDLAVIEHLSHRVLVMDLGRVVESGEARVVCRTPKHPCTQALLAAVPQLVPKDSRRQSTMPGDVPSPIDPPSGCPFHTRCPIAEARCREEVPALREVSSGHHVACHLATG